jgi:hypothetical protein
LKYIMANDRKRKEAKRNRMREQRAASKESQSKTPLANSHLDQQASSPTGKRRRLDSSANSSASVGSEASTSSERVSRHRANLTEEQRVAIRAKDAERKRRSRAKMTVEEKITEQAQNADRYIKNNTNLSESQREINRANNVDKQRRSRANRTEEKRNFDQASDTKARKHARSIMPNETTEGSNLARRERRHELAEMRASFLTPPDSSATPRAQTIEEAFGIPFFQSTKGVCYCRTALNNALGGNVFSYESLGVANIDNVNIELEETAIQECLESKGVRCDNMNNIRDLVCISEINSVGTWILRNNNTGGHYVVLKRLHIDGPLWLLDSAKQAPEITASYFYELTESLRSDDDLRNLFLLYIRFPDGYRPQCIREPSEVGIRRMLTTAPSNVCFVLIDNSFIYFQHNIFLATPSMPRRPSSIQTNLRSAINSVSSTGK